jgi:hypothetical protein
MLSAGAMISEAAHVKSVPRHAVKSTSVYHAKIRINLKNESLGRHFLLQREGRDREDLREIIVEGTLVCRLVHTPQKFLCDT